MKAAALRRAATILAVKGGGLRDITVGDCLELSVVIDGRSVRKNRGMGFYQLLHTMGVFGPVGPVAPSTIRAFGGTGQLSPAQLIDRHDIACRPIRDVLVDYLQDRQPMLDYPTMETWRRAWAGCSGGTWNAIPPASTHCTSNQVARTQRADLGGYV